MPFESEAQRRFMWAKHPKIARRWSKEHPESTHDLPMHKDVDEKKQVKRRKPHASKT